MKEKNTSKNNLTLISEKEFKKQIEFHVLHQFSFLGFLQEVKEGDDHIFGISVDADNFTSLFERVLWNMAGQEMSYEYSIRHLLNLLRRKHVNKGRHVCRELGAIVL